MELQIELIIGIQGVAPTLHSACRLYQEPAQCHDLGPMDQICLHCQALHWKAKETCHIDLGTGYGSCCNHGMVCLPPLPLPPPALRALLDGSDPKSQHFLENIQKYNAALAFTSLGVKVDQNVNCQPRPFVFQIHGELCHHTGSLLPSAGCSAAYAQLYIVDTAEACNQRIRCNVNLDAEVMQKLQDLLIDHHHYVEQFRHAYKVLADQPDSVHDVHVRLAADVQQDPCCYNLLSTNEVAVILPGDGTQVYNPCNIWVYKQDRRLWCISNGHPAYACLHYVLLFPYDTHSWHYDLLLYDDGHLQAQAQRCRRRCI
jgi:hypothetical protein